MNRILEATAACALVFAGLCSYRLTASAQSVSNMLPAEPHLITRITDDWGDCAEEKFYFAGIIFESAKDNANMARLAEQAAAAYATPVGLIKEGRSDWFLRGLEIRDYTGLKRFLISLDDKFNTDVMVVGIPSDKRFAPAAEQTEAWDDIYINEVAELGAKPCPAKK